MVVAPQCLSVAHMPRRPQQYSGQAGEGYQGNDLTQKENAQEQKYGVYDAR